MMVWEKLRLAAVGALVVIGLAAGALAQQTSKDRIPGPQPPKAEAQSSEKSNGKAAGDHRWVKTLPNGATIEVVGVSPHPSGPDTWWRPDGKPLGQPPCDRSSTSQTSDQDVVSRAVAVRITGLPAGADHSWWIDGAHGGSRGQAKLGGNPVPDLDEMVTFLDGDQATCTVRFKVAAGAWKTVQVWGTSPGARGARTGTSYIFGKPIETRKGTTLSVTHNIKDDSVRLVAVDGDGKEHPAEFRSGSGVGEFRQLVGEFDLPPKQIKEFRVQTRAFEEVEVQGVALKPARSS
jgi:hypothetical protein